jgi:3-oxocholest-4-en-26-oyl-CoA dehydrogenase alpha subunit
MDFDFTDEQLAFKKEVSDWLDEELTSEVRAEFERDSTYLRVPLKWTAGELNFNRRIGGKGWIGVHWPTKYGGGGRSLVEQFIVIDELAARSVTICNGQSLIVVPSLLVFGSEEQKLSVIPRVARGEIEVALGYTEPQAGSDLSNIGIRAVEDGDCFVINGSKMFNTMAHWASYHWLAARTDTKAVPRSRGITMFLVDMASRGITVEPLRTIDGSRTNMVYYDNVRVPRSCMIGDLNKGFYVMMRALDEERLYILTPSTYRALLADLVEYTKTTIRCGSSLFDNVLVRRRLAELDTEIECANLLYQKSIWMVANNIKATVETSVFKVFLSELGQRFMATASQILGAKSQLRRESNWVPLRGMIEMGELATILHTIGGGTSEIMRNIIAMRGCNLPRSR